MPSYNPYTDTHAIQKYQFLHHFLPHPDTKQQAKLLSHAALFMYSLMLVFFIGLVHFIPRIAPGVLGYASNINISTLLNETNRIRVENGLSELTVNQKLSNAAQKKANHMFAKNYWAHVAPDGTAPWDFIIGENYDYSYAGENLAKNFNTSKQVVDAWYNSPSHKENLLNGSYEEIGFAVVNGVLDGYETTLVVQMFGKPRAGSQVASVPAVEDTSVIATEPSEVIVETPVVNTQPQIDVTFSSEVLPAVDINIASKSITFLVSGFILVLLFLDIWYTKRKAIPKITGSAFAHVIMFVFTIAGVWFVLVPGKVL